MNNSILLSLLLAPVFLPTAWGNSVVDVVTDSNYRLRGEIVSYGKQGIVIKHPAMRQNAVILPSEIRALYFTGTSSPDLRSRDKIFMATGHRDIIPCNIISITPDKVQYRDMLGNERSIPRSQVAGFRLDTIQEKGFWQEPLIFDNSWVYSSNRGDEDYRTQAGRKLMNALKPKIQGDKYQYRLGNSDYPTWTPLYKNIGLDPSSFTFRTTMTMDGNNDRAGIVFCFGGNENIAFRSNSGSSLNRLMLSIAPGKCTLLREQKSGIIILGEVDIPTPTLTEGVDIRLTASRQGDHEQVYELLVGDLPPKLMTDPSPPEQPLQGDAFGLQMEGHVSLTISRLALSSITLSAKSVTKNGSADTDLVLTREEDAIPGSVSSYNSRNKVLTLSTDKEYPDIPRELSIPARYLDTVFFAEPEKKDDSRTPVGHSILMKDGSRLHGDILSMDSGKIILRHSQLGQISLPLKNITRVEFLNSAQPTRSTP
ncbi:hypothetical protein CXU22_12375 [Akkermansia muciniphila]|uniref:Uncharacterized protein n=1 Tax=Akkermansia muciniphila TaxID=239935 RepID=A0A2N8HC37_9BACT|nr:hypothetical protein [Akkermansia muciniphila]PNC06042.1 hypothetical protein CXU21_03070 [Akkermansia muciniphila]PNC17398.1 hypothetical protein CXU22_12375 [Akkermansia muciniphila]